MDELKDSEPLSAIDFRNKVIQHLIKDGMIDTLKVSSKFEF